MIHVSNERGTATASIVAAFTPFARCIPAHDEQKLLRRARALAASAFEEDASLTRTRLKLFVAARLSEKNETEEGPHAALCFARSARKAVERREG